MCKSTGQQLFAFEEYNQVLKTDIVSTKSKLDIGIGK